MQHKDTTFFFDAYVHVQFSKFFPRPTVERNLCQHLCAVWILWFPVLQFTSFHQKLLLAQISRGFCIWHLFSRIDISTVPGVKDLGRGVLKGARCLTCLQSFLSQNLWNCEQFPVRLAGGWTVIPDPFERMKRKIDGERRLWVKEWMNIVQLPTKTQNTRQEHLCEARMWWTKFYLAGHRGL